MVSQFPSLTYHFLPGETLLFCKGADVSIFPRVGEEEVMRIRTHVERNATVGTEPATPRPQ